MVIQWVVSCMSWSIVNSILQSPGDIVANNLGCGSKNMCTTIYYISHVSLNHALENHAHMKLSLTLPNCALILFLLKRVHDFITPVPSLVKHEDNFPNGVQDLFKIHPFS